MGLAWQCVLSPDRDLSDRETGASEGFFSSCIFGTEARWVGIRSLTGLGKPHGQGSTSPANARFIVEGK